MKYIVAPDSFKGTLSSKEVCEIAENSIKKIDREAEVTIIPVADGGEGSIDAFLTVKGGEKVKVTVSGPFFDKIESFYGLTDNGKTAIIEMAAASGLPLAEGRLNPKKATTYGVGEMILDAVHRGVKKIIMCLGGSATNDGGCGAASAIGVEFFDDQGEKFVPTGETLSKIAKINCSKAENILKNVEIITMCDVKNPLYGEKGAAFVFAPQKGASAEDVIVLDEGLKNLAEVIKNDIKIDVSEMPGAGAAGGMGAGMVSFFGSKLKSGIETIMDFTEFDDVIKGADFIITGEGKIDGQSLDGKVIDGICQRARKQNVPVIVIAGWVEDGEIERFYQSGVKAVFSINRKAEDFSVSRLKSAENLGYTVENIIRLIK